MEDHVKRELGCEEGEEPLRSVHMSLQTHVQEMVVQIWNIFLLKKIEKGGGKIKTRGQGCRKEGMM